MIMSSDIKKIVKIEGKIEQLTQRNALLQSLAKCVKGNKFVLAEVTEQIEKVTSKLDKASLAKEGLVNDLLNRSERKELKDIEVPLAKKKLKK
jgi:hypothetical protein